jgi:hypothetical protein
MFNILQQLYTFGRIGEGVPFKVQRFFCENCSIEIYKIETNQLFTHDTPVQIFWINYFVTFLAALRLEGIFLQSGVAFESAVFRCVVSIAFLSRRDSVASLNTPVSSLSGLLYSFDLRDVERL